MDRHYLLTLAAALLEAGDRAADTPRHGDMIFGATRMPAPYEYVARALDLYIAAREAPDWIGAVAGTHTPPPDSYRSEDAPADALLPDHRAAYEQRIRELEADRAVLAVLASARTVAWPQDGDSDRARDVRDRVLATLHHTQGAFTAACAIVRASLAGRKA